MARTASIMKQMAVQKSKTSSAMIMICETSVANQRAVIGQTCAMAKRFPSKPLRLQVCNFVLFFKTSLVFVINF